MTAVYLFAGLLALLVAVGLLVSPLLEREPTPADEASPEDRRDQELEALREVEFEYRTGKLSDEDYRELRARHGQAAVEARRQAEAGDAEAPPESAEPRPSGEAPSCPDCGAETRPHARFCSRCGASLEGSEA